jgi:hypothetical protein
VLLLCLVDIRFRVTSSGGYMDFKQLSFVGSIVVAIAAAAVATWAGSRRLPLAVSGVALALGWVVAAVIQDRREIHQTTPQVTAEMFQLRSWANQLPRGASIRVDVPPSGYQLWAVYMLGSHPVDSPTPLLYTTYAHAPYGVRADYSVSFRFYPSAGGPPRRYPTPAHAVNPPLSANGQFVLRKIDWPRRLASVRDTSSQALVEP